MEDRRTIRTKRVIHNAFIALLKEKPLNKITVSELSEKADLGRGTFYLHYKDVYDLYEQIEDKLYTELGKIVDASYVENKDMDIKVLSQTILEYVSSNKEAFKLFALSESYSKHLHKLRVLFCDKIFQYDKEESISLQERIDIVFLVSGITGIIEEWLAGDIDISQEQLAVQLHEIIVKF